MFTVYLPTKFCGRYFRGHTLHTHTHTFFLIVPAPKNLIISLLGNGDGRVVDKARILKAFYFKSYLHPYNLFRVFTILLHSLSFDSNSEDEQRRE